MSSYSSEFKAQIVKKMMPPNNQRVAQISRESGIHVSTLYSWKKQLQARGFVVPAKESRPDQWDTKAKLAAIIQTASMNEAERSSYCREHGIYPEQLDAWIHSTIGYVSPFEFERRYYDSLTESDKVA